MPKMTIGEFNKIIQDDLPWAHDMGIVTDRIGPGAAVLRLPFKPAMLRPGGTMAGPTQPARTPYRRRRTPPDSSPARFASIRSAEAR